jgi:hypothetical protein
MITSQTGHFVLKVQWAATKGALILDAMNALDSIQCAYIFPNYMYFGTNIGF